MGINVNYYDKVVYITSPTTNVTVQEILDAMRAAEDTPVGMFFGDPVKTVTDGFVDGEGEADLGGGFATSLTITLDANWYIEFWSGVLLGTVAGGNISGGKGSRPVRAEVGSADTVLALGAERGVLVSVGSGLSGAQDTKLDELHKLQGLDASNPMTVTPTSRGAGGVAQVISGDGENTSTVTRIP